MQTEPSRDIDAVLELWEEHDRLVDRPRWLIHALVAGTLAIPGGFAITGASVSELIFVAATLALMPGLPIGFLAVRARRRAVRRWEILSQIAEIESRSAPEAIRQRQPDGG